MKYTSRTTDHRDRPKCAHNKSQLLGPCCLAISFITTLRAIYIFHVYNATDLELHPTSALYRPRIVDTSSALQTPSV